MKKFWNWIRNADGTRTLRMDGPIDEESFWGDEITPKQFRQELESGEGDVTLWINSPGGNVFAAAEIYTMLRDYKGNITVKIDAIAASAASVIAMAGNTVLMSPVAMLMIHDPSTVAFGNAKDMEHAISVLTEVKESIINAYAAKTGLTHSRISKLMENETWMNAKKAVELGFADEILFEAKDDDPDEDDDDPDNPNTAWNNIQSSTTSTLNALKSGITSAWNSVKSGTTSAWNAIKSGLSTTWNSIKSNTTTVLNTLKSTMTSSWNAIKSTVSSAGNSIKNSISSSMDAMRSKVSSALSGIKSNFSSSFQSLISSAATWGRHICDNIASGISSAASRVISQARALAQKVRDIIGFSVPKEGPLSDADTYMPDFMELLAKGIEDEENGVIAKVRRMTEQLRSVMGGIGEGGFSFGDMGLPQLALAGGGSTTTTNNKTTNLGGVHITVNGYNVRDDDHLAGIVADKINEMLDEDDSVFK